MISVSAIVNAIIQALEPEPEVTTTGDLFYLQTEKGFDIKKSLTLNQCSTHM